MLHNSGKRILAVDVDVDAAVDIFLLTKKQVLVFYYPCTPDAAVRSQKNKRMMDKRYGGLNVVKR
jgi:hypothetical protein